MTSILNYSGLISSFILLCSLLKIYIYYKQFNISIFSFIELQDAIILFIDNLLGYLALIIPTIVFNILFYLKSSNLVSEEKYSLITIFSTNGILIIIFLSILIICLTSFYFLAKRVNTWDIVFICILLFACLSSPYAIILITKYIHEAGLDLYLNFFGILLLFIFLILILFSIISAYLEVRKVKMESFYKNVSIETEEGTITDINNYYIGKTKTYVFIYNSTDERCTVLRSDRIKTIIF